MCPLPHLQPNHGCMFCIWSFITFILIDVPPQMIPVVETSKFILDPVRGGTGPPAFFSFFFPTPSAQLSSSDED